MKKILLSFLFMASSYAFGQLSCAAPTVITGNGTLTCPTLTGTYVGTCSGSAPATTPKAIWYSYTPTVNGEVTISSNLPQNDGVTKSDDTSLSIITGACSALSCYNGNDDISSTNYLSSITFPVSAGTTYYIVWDNAYSSLGFDFTFNFTAPTCIKPNDFSINAASNITASSATVSWTAAIGNPSSYDVQHGPSGFSLGTGTIKNTTTINTSLSGLPSGGNHSYYVRSNCGATQSSWTGPFSIFLAKTAPLSNSFEAPDYGNGFSSSTWSLGNATGGAQNGTVYYFSSSSTTAATNAQLYSRALSLSAGENVSFNFWTRLGTATGSANTLKVYYNTTPSLTGATLIGSTITVTGTTYVQQSRNFIAPAAGTYYLIFSNETPIVTTAASLRLDNVSLTSVLGTKETIHNDIFLSISPNPTSDILNIKADSKIKAVSVVDITGRKVDVRLNGNTVDVKHLSAGTYLLSVETNDGLVTEKFIKK